MTCSNCGGEYLDTLSQCPFCGAENELLAQKEQQDYVMGYRNKKIDVNKIVDRKVKRANRVIWKTVGILTIVLLVGVIGRGIYSNHKAKMAFDEQQKKLEQLEIYYQADDIENLTAYYEKVDAYETLFDKYREVIYANKKLGDERGNIEEIYEHTKKYGRPSYSIDWRVQDCFYALDYMQKIVDAGYPYDNEDKISSCREQLLLIMKEQLGFSDEDIASGMEIFYSEEKDFTNLAEKAMDYIEEKAAEGKR